jgi:hypothetical protein
MTGKTPFTCYSFNLYFGKGNDPGFFFKGYVMDRRIGFIEEKDQEAKVQHTPGTDATGTNHANPKG